MNREERRRQQREGLRSRREERNAPRTWAVTPERAGAEKQDFLAGGAPVEGAALLVPLGDDGEPAPGEPSVFAIVVGDPVFTVLPELDALLARVRAEGSRAVADELRGHVRWASLELPDHPLIKLVLDLDAPLRLRGDLVLLADRYAEFLWKAAEGGFLAIARRQDLEQRPGESFADVIDRCLLLEIPPSRAIEQLIAAHGWAAAPGAAGQGPWPPQALALLQPEQATLLEQGVCATGDCALCGQPLGDVARAFTVSAVDLDDGTRLHIVPTHARCARPRMLDGIVVTTAATWAAAFFGFPAKAGPPPRSRRRLFRSPVVEPETLELPALLVNPSVDVWDVHVTPAGTVVDLQLEQIVEEHGLQLGMENVLQHQLRLTARLQPDGVYITCGADTWSSGLPPQHAELVREHGGLVLLVGRQPLTSELQAAGRTGSLLQALRDGHIYTGWVPLHDAAT